MIKDNLEPRIIPLDSYAYQRGYKEGQKNPDNQTVMSIIRQFLTWLDEDEFHGLDIEQATDFIQSTRS